ncbi:hypothetical protein BC833DRAFT_601925 [Globomyces pollinis-pini]|nr:hypothetical protein BC833DRAFT_601925 [Globomyces pollinis-pini]KAJ2993558.1 hypothetical protein HDV02_002253 [Globomyces sp. JEL0801]
MLSLIFPLIITSAFAQSRSSTVTAAPTTTRVATTTRATTTAVRTTTSGAPYPTKIVSSASHNEKLVALGIAAVAFVV